MSLQSWPLTSFTRLFPSTPTPRHAAPVHLESALNESSSFQVGLHTDEDKLRVTATAEGPDGWAVRVRRVGYVPMLHHNMQGPGNPADLDGAGQIPGYVPDPLFDESTVLLGRDETHAFWITIRPSRNTHPLRGSGCRTQTCAHGADGGGPSNLLRVWGMCCYMPGEMHRASIRREI